MPFDSMPVLDEVDLTLRNARGYIEQGWCQGELYHGNHEQHCTIGAIRMALGWHYPSKNPLYNKSIRRLVAALPEQHRRSSLVYSVMKWNDAPLRTKEEVLELLDKAIQKGLVLHSEKNPKL